MRGKKLAAFAGVASLLSSCAFVRNVAVQEVRTSGGYGGYLLDRRTFDAQSKRDQLLRMTIIVALAARVSNATVTDGSDAEDVVNQLSSTVEELNYLAGYLNVSDECRVFRAAGDCGTYFQLFESDIPRVEAKIVRLVLAVLPRRQAAGFARAAASGKVLSAALRFLQLARASVDALHRGAAAYRSVEEVLATAVYNAGACQTAPPDSHIPTTEAAVACLNLPLDRLFQGGGRLDQRIWEANTATGYRPIHMWNAMYQLTRYSCRYLPPKPVTATAQDPQAEIAENITRRQKVCDDLSYAPRVRFPSTPPAPAPVPAPLPGNGAAGTS